jgi:hypothetical protein
LPLVRAPGIVAEILFYREAVKKIGAESPTPALRAGGAPKSLCGGINLIFIKVCAGLEKSDIDGFVNRENLLY